MCNLHPLLLCSVCQIIQLLASKAYAQYKQIQTLTAKLNNLRRRCHPMGLTNNKRNTGSASTINRRLIQIDKYFEYLNTTVDENIDLVYEFVSRELKNGTNYDYKEWLSEQCHKDWVRAQNDYIAGLRNDEFLKTKIAYTEVLRYFSQRDTMAFRKAVIYPFFCFFFLF